MSAPNEASREALVTLARKCERLAADSPSIYRLRVTVLALLGYLFAPIAAILMMAAAAVLVWTSITMTEGFGAGFLVVNVGGSLIVLTVMVVRAMMPVAAKPAGVRLRRAGAPRLFSFVEKVRRNTRGPRIHRVYLTHDMNAGVSQTPRLGFLGWYRNELYLGLPILQTLTSRQLAAVLAHEFGHLSAAHGKHRAWIYRSRILMIRILGAIEEKRRLGSSVLLWFYQWYAPYFSAYSFALARAQEYEADLIGAKATSGQTLVDALVRISVATDYVSYIFETDIFVEADKRPDPPGNIYRRIGGKLKALARWPGAARSLDASLACSTEYVDTHPSLSDRAAALGAKPRLPVDSSDTAEALLPGTGGRLAEILSQHWQKSVGELWEELHTEALTQRVRLSELDTAAKRGRLAENEAIERALLAERHLGTEAALSRINQATLWYLDSDEVLFVRGRLLLALLREEGLSCLDRLMDRNEEAVIPACQLAEAYLETAGREDEAEVYRQRRIRQEALFEADEQNLEQIADTDVLLPHQLGPEVAMEVAQAIGRFRYMGLRAAWLVRKSAGHRESGGPHLLVCEVAAFMRWTGNLDELGDRLAAALAHLDTIAVTVCEPGEHWLRDKADMVPGAQVFPAADRALGDTGGGGLMSDAELLALHSLLSLPDNVVLFLRDQPLLNTMIKGIRTFAVLIVILIFLLVPLLFPQLYLSLLGIYFRAGLLPQNTLMVEMSVGLWPVLFACLASIPLGVYLYRLWMRLNRKRYLQSIASLLSEIVAPRQKLRSVLVWLTRHHLAHVDRESHPQEFLMAYERRSATTYCGAALVLYLLALLTFAADARTATRVTRDGTVLQAANQKSYTWQQAISVQMHCTSDPDSARWIRSLYHVRFEDGQTINLTRYFAPEMSSISAVLSVDQTLRDLNVPFEIGVIDPKCPTLDMHFINLVKRQRGLQSP